MSFNYLGTNSLIGRFEGTVHSELAKSTITNTTRRRHDGYTLPADVVFYAPLNDPIGTPVHKAATFTSLAGSTRASRVHNAWSHTGDDQLGAFVADLDDGIGSDTIPFGNTSCYHSSDNSTRFAVETEQGKTIFYDRISGTGIDANVRNFTIEMFYFLPSSDAWDGQWARLFRLGGWGSNADGIEAQRNSNSNNSIKFRFHTTSNNSNSQGVTLVNMGTNKWKYFRMCWDVENGRVVFHHGGSGGGSGTVARRLDSTQSYFEDDFTLEGRDVASAQLALGHHQTDDNKAFKGGFNELIIRVDDPDATTKNDSDFIAVPSSPLISL